MKRTLIEPQANQETIVSKVKRNEDEPLAGQIFSIAQIERNNTEGSLEEQKRKDSEADKLRVCVSSKVNFSKLNAQEQYARFQNQAKKIKKLRMKLKRYGDENVVKEDTEIRKALKRIKESRYELQDQKDMIENLIKAINSGKLVPNTLPYNQICTILRDALGINYPDCHYSIMLPEGSIPISALEYAEYTKLPCSSSNLGSFVGRAQVDSENYGEFLRALHLQFFSNISQSSIKNLPGLIHK